MFSCKPYGELLRCSGGSRNKTRLAKVVVVANSKQKCLFRTHNVVKYTSKNFGYEYTLYWASAETSSRRNIHNAILYESLNS